MSFRTARGWAIYLVFIALVVPVLLEGALRLFGAAPLSTQYSQFVADRYLPWKFAPNSISHGTTPEFAYEYHHDSTGFRNLDRNPQKPAGTLRIVALGDSFTYGVGASDTETYPARAEQILNTSFGATRPIEVLNLGMPRFWPELERLALEYYGLARQPDLVTVAFLPNDVLDTQAGKGSLEVREGRLVEPGRDPLGGAGAWFFARSALVRVLYRARQNISAARTGAGASGPPTTAADSAPYGAMWQNIESEYANMLALSKRVGAKFAVIFIPQSQPWPPPADSYPRQRLRAWASAQDVPFIDTTQPLETAAASGMRIYYPQDGHTTPAGYNVIAQTLAAEVVRLKLLPLTSPPGVDQQ